MMILLGGRLSVVGGGPDGHAQREVVEVEGMTGFDLA